MNLSNRPHWQLPTGVSRGLWEYAHSQPVADDYDDYFAYNRLFELDEAVLAKHLPPKPDGDSKGIVADLGCGTGRALFPLARRGFRGLAVDLSEHMLRIVRQKADAENLPIDCLRANIVELDCLPDDCVDGVICLFSTLGMIRGRGSRQRVLEHARRILRPGGAFVLHVHNYLFNLYDPGGPWWFFRNLFGSLVDPAVERGDKYFDYRGVPKMYLHVFTKGEIRRSLVQAGFRIAEMMPLDRSRARSLRWPWLLGQFRANGWVVVCR